MLNMFAETKGERITTRNCKKDTYEAITWKYLSKGKKGRPGRETLPSDGKLVSQTYVPGQKTLRLCGILRAWTLNCLV